MLLLGRTWSACALPELSEGCARPHLYFPFLPGLISLLLMQVCLNVHSKTYYRQTAVSPARGFQLISHKFRFLVDLMVLVPAFVTGCWEAKTSRLISVQGLCLISICFMSQDTYLVERMISLTLQWEQKSPVLLCPPDFASVYSRMGLKKQAKKPPPAPVKRWIFCLGSPGWDQRSPLFSGEIA